jgi:hypothetical protein
MKGTKFGLLILIVAFGSTVETAWQVRQHLGPRGWGWFWGGDRFHGPSFTFTTDQVQTVEAGTPVEVENAFGGVKITQGAPGEVRISMRKVVFLETQDKAHAYADRIQLQARREGAALRVSTNRPDLEQETPRGSQVGFETHLDLLVPPGTPVKVRNEHGPIAVADVAAAEVVGSHDDVRVERVGGPVQIEARHGEVRASAIKGALKVTCRHGDVTLEDVEGAATVDAQHGEVKAARVGGLVVNGAHGDVTAETVRGDLEVHSQHGAVRGVDVTGRAQVEASFQGVTLERVGGDAAVRTEHGDVSVTDVAGAVDAEASFDDVVITRAGGLVTATVRHGAVRGRGLGKGARVRASGDEVVLEDFRGPVEVDSERAGVRLVPAGAIEAGVRVTAKNGGVELDVPAGSRIDVQASAEPGEVSVDVPGLSATQIGRGRFAGTLGGGGNAVVLATTHGEVRLHGTTAVAEKKP